MSILYLKKGTERPFPRKHNSHCDTDTYCKGCDTKLFKNNSKFDSGCGWPSFNESIEDTVKYIQDTSHEMIRTEIVCANCGSYLGHVFNDEPTETGQRYFMN